MREEPLLSICIPTWNRAKCLKLSLETIDRQLKDIEEGLVEVFVSDNGSDDETQSVLQPFIQTGLVRCNRNPENLGYDRNFLKCIQGAKGKYIMLVGDDDIFNDGAISYIVKILQQDDWGLVHIATGGNRGKGENIYTNSEDIFKRISFWTTFISANIFRSDIVEKVSNPEHYFKSLFLHIPYYINTVLAHSDKNIVISLDTFKPAPGGGHNGGYNIFQVFVANYLGIWKEYVDAGKLSTSLYEYLKKDILESFLKRYIYNCLIRKKDVKKIDQPEKVRGGFAIEGAWKILFSYYGKYLYFYKVLGWVGLKTIYDAILKPLIKIVKR